MEVMLPHTSQLTAGGWLTHPESKDLGSHSVHLAGRSHRSAESFVLFHLPDLFFFPAAPWHVPVAETEGSI